jgi:glycogen operon protein
MINAYTEPLTFAIQDEGPGRCRWLRAIDTALESPDDIADPGSEAPVALGEYHVEAHSVVVLIGEAVEALSA